MNSQHEPQREGAEGFRTTRWSAVLLSAQSEAPGSKAALADLCRIYWYPIYSFVRRRGYDAHLAQDLTQGFFLHLLDRKALRRVNPVKGRFRSFLAASLQNYLSDEFDRTRCLKRGGGVEFLPLDAEHAEQRYSLETADALTADKIFDARWALTLLDEAMNRLGADYAVEGKARVFETLKVFLNPMTSNPSLSYAQAAEALEVGESAVKTLIHRLRRRYTALLREEVARTVGDPAEVDEEIHALCGALIAAQGRLD